MTLQQLEYIVALDNYRHFVKAAESCFVTQPTLTMQVKKLEEEIGIQLFERTKKPLVPTPAGEYFIGKARQILHDIDELKAYVSDEVESMEGEYRLSIIPTLAPYVLPLFLPHFIKHYPKTKLIIQEQQTEVMLEALQKGTIDLGILVTPVDQRGIREIPVFNESFMVYLPENSTEFTEKLPTPEDLNPDQLLLLEEGHCFRAQALELCQSRTEMYGHGFAFQSGSIEALKHLVQQNLGYTLVPELAVTKEEYKKNVRRFADPQPTREVSIVVHNSFTKEALIEGLRDSIQSTLPAGVDVKNQFVRIKWK
ncbi:MAG: LysR substrate-binding domain-containing protein [Crocinitomicaceae bacterium]|jgi:LysR family hydrogen peroxide-inducible transcriptional activator|nr:LysR substrate-binding domain-containing protein [Crocinitomicaceae bacterium]